MVLSYTNSGNLSSDSRWNYAWNDRQRLASVETSQRAVSAGAPKVKYVYSYNWKGLKTKAEKYTWDTANSSWTLYCTNHRYYDDHNLIYERTVYASGVRDIYGNQMPETCNKYYYGIDLTGNVYASGGTGGIRMMNLNGKVAYPYNNATGNIEALFDDNGSLLAEYEYSPFGSIRCIRGSFADKNPMRFSSRYSEADTGLYYYSYRHYSPSLKKWLSHDPLGEHSTVNTYNYVNNIPTVCFDVLGLFKTIQHRCVLIEKVRDKKNCVIYCNYNCSCPYGYFPKTEYRIKMLCEEQIITCFKPDYKDALLAMSLAFLSLLDGPFPIADTAAAGIASAVYGTILTQF